MSDAIQLVGEMTISAADAARVQRDQLLQQAAAVTTVSDRLDADDATAVLRELTHYSKTIEAARTKAKAPALDVGRKIDALAKELADKVVAEAGRISRAVGAFEAEERRKAEAARIEAENKAQDIARKAREDAAKAARSAPDAETAIRKADAIVEKAALEAVAVREQAAAVAAPKAAGTMVREDVVFEVLDIKALYAAAPELVNLEPNGNAIRSACRMNPNLRLPGLRHWKERKLLVK